MPNCSASDGSDQLGTLVYQTYDHAELQRRECPSQSLFIEVPPAE
jgi:hypothetical protein